MKSKSLVWICTALEARRAENKGIDAHIPLNGQFTAEIRRLMDEEDFKRLDEAKRAIESGYFSFLSNLCLICYWLQREAKNPHYVTGITKNGLRDIETKHSKELEKLEDELAAEISEVELQEVRKRWEKQEEFRKQFKADKGIPHKVRITYAETDLPTRGTIREMHQETFPTERKFWKAHPNEIAAIWRDAGLSWVPQTRIGKHPHLAERIESLKAFLSELSDP